MENDQNEDEFVQSSSTTTSDGSNRYFRTFHSVEMTRSFRQKYPSDYRNKNKSKYPTSLLQQAEKNYLSTKITPHRSNTRYITKRRRRADYSSELENDTEWNDIYIEPSRTTTETANITNETQPTNLLQLNQVNVTQASTSNTEIGWSNATTTSHITITSPPTSISTPVVDLARDEFVIDLSTHPAVFSTPTIATNAMQTTSNIMYSSNNEDEATNQTIPENTSPVTATSSETTPYVIPTTISTPIEDARPLPIPPHSVKFLDEFGLVAEYINPR